MKEKIEKEYPNVMDLPRITIAWCYDRAVVSFKDGYLENPVSHIKVPFGLFFKWRINRAISKIIIKHFNL